MAESLPNASKYKLIFKLITKLKNTKLTRHFLYTLLYDGFIPLNVMKNFEQIKKLRENVSQIRNLFNVKFPQWKSDEKRYDKIGSGFNVDDRFKSCTKIEIWFSSWMGTYGDSSCSSQLRLDADIFKQHFLKYLNTNQKEIMLLISNSIEKEAVLLKEKALEEVNAQIEELMELDNIEEAII